MKISINQNFLRMKENYLFSEVKKRLCAYTDAHPNAKLLRLGVGDVTLPLPKIVSGAMEQAAREMGEKSTFRGYPPEYGYDFLRSAIAAKYAALGVEVAPDEVFVSDGAKSDLGNILDVLGDNEVVIPDPVYPAYVDGNLISGRKITMLECVEEENFLPMPNRLEVKPQVIYLCSPNNPTGAVYTRRQLGEWVKFARLSGSLIIFDAAYEGFVMGDYPHTIYEIEGARECAAEICSFSKTAGFTGVRAGWSVFSSALEACGVKIKKLWERRQSTKFNGVGYIVQRGAEAALTAEGAAECGKNVSYYLENARILAELLKKKGIFFTGGENSPYVWFKCPNGMSSWELFDYLLEKIQVVGTPGVGFGDAGEGYFRLTAFGGRESVLEAAARLDGLL